MKKELKRISLLLILALMLCLTAGLTAVFAEGEEGEADNTPDISETIKSLTFHSKLNDKDYPWTKAEDGSLVLNIDDVAYTKDFTAKAEAADPENKVWLVITATVAGRQICRSFELTSDEWFHNTVDFSYTVSESQFYLFVGKTKPSNKYPIVIPDNDYMYTVRTILKPALKSMEIVDNDTLLPEFAWNQHEYTVYIPEEQETVTINCESAARNGRNEAQITYNGEENKEIPIVWNYNDEMDINIHLANTMDSSDYIIHLKKEPDEDIPAFILQPRDATYFDVDTPERLTVRATANEDVTYQWYKSDTEEYENGMAIQGATEAYYTPEIPYVGEIQEKKEFYFCRATSVKGEEYVADSEFATISIKPDPTPYDMVLMEEDGGEIPEEGFTYKVGDESEHIKVAAKSRAKGGTWKYLWNWMHSGEEGRSTYTYSETDTVAIPTDHEYDSTFACHVQYIYDGETYEVSKDVAPVMVYTDKAPEIVDLKFNPINQRKVVGSPVSIINFSFCSSESNGENNWSTSWQISEDGVEYNDITASDTGFIIPLNANVIGKFTPKEQEGTHYYRLKIDLTYTSVTGEIYQAETVYSPELCVQFFESIIPFDGDGTETKPYLIETTEDLEVLSALADAGDNFKNKYFLFTEDITLPVDWQPIGSSTEKFSGNIDGGGHLLTIPVGEKCLLKNAREATVSNLDIFGERIEGYGLVEYYGVDYGPHNDYSECPWTIKINNVNIKSGSRLLQSGFIGGWASGHNFIWITNCTVEDDVVIGCDKNASDIGSFAGSVNAYIYNCTSHATVYGNNRVGGIAGAKNQSMGPFEIKNCVFDGEVIATGAYVGGIAGGGYVSNAPNSPCVTVQNCICTGNVTGGNLVGGIFGGEGGVTVCWDNGIGYIQNNLFTGTIKSTGDRDGGIIGNMSSLDKYNIISNNYYREGCGAEKGIGGYWYYFEDRKAPVFTDYESPFASDDIEYKNAAEFNRHDDPAGADADKLAKAVSAEELRDGTITDLLNNGENSFHNWTQDEDHPTITSDPVAYELVIGGEFKSEYVLGDDLDLTGIEFTATMTDGTTVHPTLDDVTVEGYDKNTRGNQTLRFTYGAATAETVVKVLKPEVPVDPDDPEPPAVNTINVTFTLLGDTAHGFDPDHEPHCLAGDNLTPWISNMQLKVGINDTVWDVMQKVAEKDSKLSWSNPSGNYIDFVTYDGVTIGEFTNGQLTGWMYTLNGTHPHLGVSEQYLEDGDVIVFHYTDDYTLEEGSDQFGGETMGDNLTDAKAKIKALPGAGSITLDDEALVVAAREAYDKLTAEEKVKVFSKELAKLTAAEEAIAKLKEEAAEAEKKAKEEAVKEAQELIAEVDKLVADDYTADSFKAVTDAKAALEALLADEKSTSADIIAAKTRLVEAVTALKTKGQEADDVEKARTAAAAAIAAVDKLKASDYTAKSFKAVTDAKAALEALLAKTDAKSTEIDAARASLEKAVSELVQMKKNTLKVTRKNKTYRVKALKKAKKSYKAVIVKKAKGKVTYKVTGNKKSKKALKFNKKTRKITVKKGTKKGTYKLKIRVKAAGTALYKAGSKTVTVKVRVK